MFIDPDMFFTLMFLFLAGGSIYTVLTDKPKR